MSIYLNEFTGTSGIIKADLGSGQSKSIAMNYARQESVLIYYSLPEILQTTKNLGENITIFEDTDNAVESRSSVNKDLTESVPLTRILLILALVMVVIETLLFRVKT